MFDPKGHHEAVLNSPAAWRRQAGELFEAAQLIQPKLVSAEATFVLDGDQPEKMDAYLDICGREPVYFMLIGFALENLLKGLLVQQGRNVLCSKENEGRTTLEKPFGSHNLRALAEDVGRGLAGKEERTLLQSHEGLLTKITACSVWAGRYPMPTT